MRLTIARPVEIFRRRGLGASEPGGAVDKYGCHKHVQRQRAFHDRAFDSPLLNATPLPSPIGGSSCGCCCQDEAESTGIKGGREHSEHRLADPALVLQQRAAEQPDDE